MRIFLILLIFTVVTIASLPAQNMSSERLTIENGLSQGMVFDLCQTRDGFLWVTTKDGLNRYDGYNFKVFSNNPFDPFSLAENTATALFEDSRGWLWVGTETNGLDLFDPRTGRFHHFPMNFAKTHLSERVAILKIQETADGAIWVIKGGLGLIRVEIPETWKKTLPDVPDLSGSNEVKPFSLGTFQTPDDRIFNLELTCKGDLLVTSRRAQFIVDPFKQTFKRVHEPVLTNILQSSALSKRGGTDLNWFLFSDRLSCLSDGVLHTIKTPTSLPGQRRSLSTDEAGNIWLNIQQRIWKLDPEQAVDFDKPDLEIPEPINCFKHDRNGNLWIGTQGYGLYKIYPPQKCFHAGAAGSSIAGLWRSPQGLYYCKSYLSVISAYDPVSGALDSQTAFPDAGGNQEALAFDTDGNTWLLNSKNIIADEAVLSRYNLAGQLTGSYPLGTKLSHREQLFFSRTGKLWITLGSCQMIRFNPVEGVKETFNFAELFGDKTATVMITSLVEGLDGLLWVGTQLGLVKGVPNKQSFDFQLIQADPNLPTGLNSHSIACLLLDPLQPDSVLWIGTKGGGINRFNLQTNQCRHITTADGLPNNVVYGILADQHNNLWCSTNRGLAKVTQRPGDSSLAFDVTAFTVKMGLQDNEFNSFAYFKAANGELLFGGVNGLNRFFPEELQQDTLRPPVYVVGLEINHISAPPPLLSGPVEALRKLVLSYNQNNLSFEFAALDFTDPAKNRYRYQLLGLDENWVETGTNRFAHFAHLPPGRYELRVQGSSGESGWQEAANSIVILIHPPWWRSNLAYLGYLLLLVWLGWKGHQAQIRRVKMEEKLSFGIREAERIHLLEQMKTNFFNNITHEFRTPLTLIIEPLRQLLKTTPSETWRSKVQLAEANSRKLLGLVNQLLDMAKLESGSMALDLRRGDIKQTIRAVVETFLPVAAQRDIKLSLVVSSKVSPFSFDAVKVESILNNLISNALKFTPALGTITIDLRANEGLPFSSVSRSGIQDLASILITVNDTGMGIPPESLDKVFDRFYQVDGSHTRAGSGTGIGLSLSKELAELMHGGLAVSSVLGKGSSFTFWLPAIEMVEDHALEPRVTTLELSSKVVEGTDETERPMVLIIEDNAELRGFVKQSIAEHWQVIEASNGDEGLRKAIELLPDLVISDVMMPQKDGYAVCDALKTNELTAHIPIILLTAKSGIDSKIKGLRTGADDYLTKPFNTEELLARMENLVELRRKLLHQYGKRNHLAKPLPTDKEVPEFLSSPDRAFLRKLRLTIEQQIDNEALSIESLAQILNISRMQLHRKLKALSNQSATEYIRIYRLERAMALLQNKEGNVKQVSKMVGFGNEKYFSKSFKEHFGVLPSEV
jgi:signal transduction histidine kinase/DNA-binding response OmpR family regulator/ligand-binding sensor domain-containing protein